MDIGRIHQAIQKEVYFREHAIQKLVERNIAEKEVVEAIESGEIIEEYPVDKYGPTCLIFGLTESRRPLHVLVSYSVPIWVVTAYEPDERQWLDHKIRR